MAVDEAQTSFQSSAAWPELARMVGVSPDAPARVLHEQAATFIRMQLLVIERLQTALRHQASVYDDKASSAINDPLLSIRAQGWVWRQCAEDLDEILKVGGVILPVEV